MRLCCRQHDRSWLLQSTQTMFHVFFRSIFGIPPLILVLLPVTSSDCEIEEKNKTIIMKDYIHLLHEGIEILEKAINFANCSSKEYSSLKNHTCDDKEVTFIVHVTCKLKQLVKANNIPENLSHSLEVYSHHALGILKGCKCDEVNGTEKKAGGPCFFVENDPNKNPGEKSAKEQKKERKCKCLIKKMVSDVKNCWRKFLMTSNGD
ncbi:interleukin-7 [Monodelphis domestica]|uniref:Interleukin-7 n=1 Tax=Monodelphis domestica TaxID=13616 RepID=A0A5F8GQJ7_MONDO|nr:interleukin-7 [Monodelphis domestica]